MSIATSLGAVCELTLTSVGLDIFGEALPSMYIEVRVPREWPEGRNLNLAMNISGSTSPPVF